MSSHFIHQAYRQNGEKWWLFLNCEKCNYDWSFWKVERRANEAPQVMEVTA